MGQAPWPGMDNKVMQSTKMTFVRYAYVAVHASSYTCDDFVQHCLEHDQAAGFIVRVVSHRHPEPALD